MITTAKSQDYLDTSKEKDSEQNVEQKSEQ